MKKIILSIGIAAILAGAAFASFASAQNDGTSAAVNVFPVVQVNEAGSILLRGKLDAVSSSSLTIKSWGGTWIVNVLPNAEILPVTAGNDLSQFHQGDMIGVLGTVSTAADWTVNATIVRDWTYRKIVRQEQQQTVATIKNTLKSDGPRNFVGTVSAVASSSFSLTEENSTTFTVTMAGGAQVANRNWVPMAFADIKNGDSVRVWGISINGNLSASIIRDVSIPASTPGNSLPPIPPLPSL